jgi:Fe-S cluster assembly iron-binding protein IscA
MVFVTPSAVARLKALILEHPEDPIVRLAIKDPDEARVVFSITLEAVPLPDDDVQTRDGLTVAIAAASAARMDGVTLDYVEPGGFLFRHPAPPGEDALHQISMN